mgnify:CR=1 FL=1
MKYYLRISILLISLICIVFVDTAKVNNRDSLNIIQVKNHDLKIIIDSIAAKNQYYIINWDGRYFIINAVKKIKRSKRYMGCIKYKSHLFLISASSLDKRLFERTPCYEYVKFYRSKTRVDRKGHFFLDYIDTDHNSIATWIYMYMNNKFVLFQKGDKVP